MFYFATMTLPNKLSMAPPYPVEQTLQHLGANLRIARLRRNLTIKDIAEKIGTGTRAVRDAEKGKASTAVAVYVALLWALGLIDQMDELADPAKDEEGQLLAIAHERNRARQPKKTDNDF